CAPATATVAPSTPATAKSADAPCSNPNSTALATAARTGPACGRNARSARTRNTPSSYTPVSTQSASTYAARSASEPPASTGAGAETPAKPTSQNAMPEASPTASTYAVHATSGRSRPHTAQDSREGAGETPSDSGSPERAPAIRCPKGSWQL